MPSARALPPEIEQALARDWVVLTGNQRAARTLRHAYDLQQHALDRSAWQPPPIYAWDTWTNLLWVRLLLDSRDSRLLLSSTQERTLWRAVIADDPATASLQTADALAQGAADAWKLLHDYRGLPRLQAFPGNSDTSTFARWAAEFERRCKRSQYLSEAELPETLRTHIAVGHISPQEGFLLIGFDHKTPAQSALLDAVRDAGAEVAEPPTPPASSLTLAAAPDEHAELTACAEWLRERLTAQPDASLAVIAPNIDADRAEIDRVFRSILAPELNDIAAPAASGPYEFSLGRPLAHTPIIAAALDILRWADGPLSLDRISILLLSPHFAADHSADERLSRAEFDAFILREQHLLEPRLSLEALLKLILRKEQGPKLPILVDRLRDLNAFLAKRGLSGRQPYASWAETFHKLLEAAGWAPLPRLDSVEFQTRRKWDDTLDELATLDFESTSDGARVSFDAALTELERIAVATLFAPESRHAPVQIMGPLESAGSSFDAVWFLRANDVAWPAASAPNPLLPWQLQRQLAMPGANPILHTEAARRTTERIAAMAPEVVFSYAQQSADGPQRPSPVLSSLTLERRDLLSTATTQAPLIQLETLEDIAPLPPPPGTILRGGASILKAQAQCAFRAFAERRLFSAAPETTELGLDERERGSLVHRILQLFWTETNTQQRLLEMPRAERGALLTRSIETALDEEYRRIDAGWPEAYLATERRRLFRLLDAWLDFECERPPFEVRDTEKELKDVAIGPLHIDVRVDRIDNSISNGEPAGEIILDYKTGSVAPTDWLGERPDEPQLPLYAVVSQPAPIAAVAFANVRLGEKQPLKGYESRKGVLPRATKLKTDTLDTQIDKWRNVLTVLANQFHDGEANAAPKQYPSTCRYCDQRLLCRLDLATLEADANEDFYDTSDPTVDSLEPPAEAELE